MQVFNLIKAKKALFDLIKQCEDEEKMPSESETKRLLSYADQAAEAGYLNAYFILGQYFSKIGLQDKALRIFIKVPTSAPCYHKVLNIITEDAYALALDRSISNYERNAFLKLALQYALKIESDEIRYQIIQKVAYSYITEGKETGMEKRNPVKADMLQAMHEGTGVAWCFRQFDRLKKARLRKMECIRLTAENTKLVAQVLRLENVIDRLCEVKPKQDENPQTLIASNESLMFSDVAKQDVPSDSTDSLESEKARKRQRLKGKDKMN
jgi:hypothetical protein